MLIDSIYKDHGYINRIIQLLDKKLNRLEEEKTVNYNVIRESVDYLSSFAEKITTQKKIGSINILLISMARIKH